MFLNILAIIVALAISAAAATFSIIGLMALFAGAWIGVLIMGTALEAGKIVTAIWLHKNWKNVTGWIRLYLCVAVAILMFITSMGIFGYLSRAHLEQNVKMEIHAVSTPLEAYDIQITEKEKLLADLDSRIKQFDTLIGRQTAQKALDAFKKEAKTRSEIAAERGKLLTEISELRTKKQLAIIKTTTEKKAIELEIGPLKYAADFIYGKASEDQIEKTVRWVIVILIAVFDPLAIFLLVAATMTISKKEAPPEVKVVYRKKIGRPLGSRNKGRVVMDNDIDGGGKRKIQVRAANSSVKIVDPPSVDLTKFTP
jgi:hypothetical protein